MRLISDPNPSKSPVIVEFTYAEAQAIRNIIGHSSKFHREALYPKAPEDTLLDLYRVLKDVTEMQ